MDRETRRNLKREPFRNGGTCMGVVHGYPACYCSRTGTADRSGKLYCKQHDPGDPEENRRKRLAKWAEDERKAEEYIARVERRLLEEKACAFLSNDDLRRIIEACGLTAKV